MGNINHSEITLLSIEKALTAVEQSYKALEVFSFNEIHNDAIREIRKQLYYEITTLSAMQRHIARCEQTFTNKGEKPHKLTVSGEYEICLFCCYSHKIARNKDADIIKASG